MKKVVIAAAGSLILVACSQTETTPEVKQTQVTVEQEEQRPVVHPTKVLSMEISGMSCEMGCGSAIRKELYTTNAVDEVKFDFKMGRDVNKAEIYFDDSKVSEKEISTLISELNDKQFTIGKTSVSDYKKESESEESKSTTSGGGSSGAAKSSFTEIHQNPFEIKVPNLIDLLMGALFRK